MWYREPYHTIPYPRQGGEHVVIVNVVLIRILIIVIFLSIIEGRLISIKEAVAQEAPLVSRA